MSNELQFRFDLDKAINALAHFAASGVSDLTKLKAAKLLYLADQYHFHRYGRPITGDRYVAMDYGPVPEDVYQLLGRLHGPDEITDVALAKATSALEIFRGVFRQYRYPVLRAKHRPDLDVFSDSEIDALNAVIDAYGTTAARTLVDLTHEHRAYKRANAIRATGSSVTLPYEYFFEDAPAELREQAIERAEREQEAREFGEALRTAAAKASSTKRERLAII